MFGSRVTSSTKVTEDGRIRVSIMVDGRETEHKWFARSQSQRASEWASVAVMRTEDEVYQNAKG